MSEDEDRKCLNCGTHIPNGSLTGQCPACLLQIGLKLGAPSSVHFSDQTSPSRTSTFGDYEIIELIALGGMGVVYKARQTSLNRLVALKMIRTGELANDEEVLRFQAEAEAAANLDHPNIVPVYEVGTHGDRHYFSMKLVEGGNLATRKPESIESAVRVLATVARAVHYAHQRGILHRDLKPENILLDLKGEPHVSDFGLAKRMVANSSLTLAGRIFGTPAYIAPEQAAQAKVLTTAMDIYSLGAILYELLTGQPPFCGSSVLDTLSQVREKQPKTPRRINPGIDRDLERICLKCLEKEPTRRYGSAEALSQDLERWLAHEPVHARPAAVLERIAKWTQRKPAVATLVAIVITVTLTGLLGVIWEWRTALSERGTAEAAKRRMQEQLWASQLIEARYYRTSGKPGQQFKALEILQAAAAHRPSLALRNEAVAAVLLPDFGSNLWFDTNAFLYSTAADGDFKYYIPHRSDGIIEIRSTLDQKAVATVKGLGLETTWIEFSPDGPAPGGLFRLRDRQRFLRLVGLARQQAAVQGGLCARFGAPPRFRFHVRWKRNRGGRGRRPHSPI